MTASCVRALLGRLRRKIPFLKCRPSEKLVEAETVHVPSNPSAWGGRAEAPSPAAVHTLRCPETFTFCVRHLRASAQACLLSPPPHAAATTCASISTSLEQALLVHTTPHTNSRITLAQALHALLKTSLKSSRAPLPPKHLPRCQVETRQPPASTLAAPPQGLRVLAASHPSSRYARPTL